MNIEYFPYFIKNNYPHIEISGKESILLGEEFEKYLLDTFKDNQEMLSKIWDINPIKVIMDKTHPFKVNGYDPVFILHFNQFIKQKIEKER